MLDRRVREEARSTASAAHRKITRRKSRGAVVARVALESDRRLMGGAWLVTSLCFLLTDVQVERVDAVVVVGFVDCVEDM